MYCKVIFIHSLGKFSDTLGIRGTGCAGLSYSNKDITASRCPYTEPWGTSRNVVERQKRMLFSASCQGLVKPCS